MPRKATKKRKPSFKKLAVTPLLHWATRHKTPEPEHLKVRGITVLASTLQEAAAISVASDLIQGKMEGNSDLVSEFNSQVEWVLEDFKESYPDYKFVTNGRPSMKTSLAE